MPPKRFCTFCGQRLSRMIRDGRWRLVCGACRMPVYENPIPATCLVVDDPQERVLLVRRSIAPKRGCWCLPGGFMELGETPEAAARRELSEETGLWCPRLQLLGVCSTPNSNYDTVLMVGYAAAACQGQAVPGDDADAVDWFARSRLPELAFDSHRHFVRLTGSTRF